MRQFWVLLCLLLGLLTSCSTTTVYIVRHAEKVNESDTTDLSPIGHQRAQALAEVLANKGIDSIFTTPTRRTRQTAAPLAKRLTIQSVDYSTKSIEIITERVRRIQNKTVLVVGHSNTILPIAIGLGAKPTMTKIESGDFDNLFRVRLKRGKVVDFSQTTYGQPTPP